MVTPNKQRVCAWGDPTLTKREGETDTVRQKAPKSWKWALWGRGMWKSLQINCSIPPVSHEALVLFQCRGQSELSGLPVCIKRLLFAQYPGTGPKREQHGQSTMGWPDVQSKLKTPTAERLLLRHLWPFKPLPFPSVSLEITAPRWKRSLVKGPAWPLGSTVHTWFPQHNSTREGLAACWISVWAASKLRTEIRSEREESNTKWQCLESSVKRYFFFSISTSSCWSACLQLMK